MAVPAHDGKGHLMVPGGQFITEKDTSREASGRHAVFLLSPQSSALSPYLMTLNLEPLNLCATLFPPYNLSP
jgi:hypothetical protein